MRCSLYEFLIHSLPKRIFRNTISQRALHTGNNLHSMKGLKVCSKMCSNVEKKNSFDLLNSIHLQWQHVHLIEKLAVLNLLVTCFKVCPYY